MTDISRACAACAGTCCRVGVRPFYPEDLAVLMASPHASIASTIMSERGLDPDGFMMEGQCAFLGDEGCVLEDDKPLLCAEWYCHPARKHQDGFISMDELVAKVSRDDWPETLLESLEDTLATDCIGSLNMDEFSLLDDQDVLNEAAPPDEDIERWILSMKNVIPKKDHGKIFAKAWGMYKRGAKPVSFKSKASAKRYFSHAS